MNLKDPATFFSILAGVNIITYILNILISISWDALFAHESQLKRYEIKLSLITLLVNIIIAVPGYIMWKIGIIQFVDINPWLSFACLFLLMDFLMYALHWASHNVGFLKTIHAKHHEHDEVFNCVSLYFMSPWESIFFGLLLTVIAVFVPLNIYSFIAFLFFNWIYGVITHLNNRSRRAKFLIFTTNMFHKNHHQLLVKNYGFYTIIWDKIFGTDTK